MNICTKKGFLLFENKRKNIAYMMKLLIEKAKDGDFNSLQKIENILSPLLEGRSQIADYLDLSYSYYSKIRNGKRKISESVYKKLLEMANDFSKNKWLFENPFLQNSLDIKERDLKDIDGLKDLKEFKEVNDVDIFEKTLCEEVAENLQNQINNAKEKAKEKKKELNNLKEEEKITVTFNNGIIVNGNPFSVIKFISEMKLLGYNVFKE